jgi:uncharacterized iron-regulated membrane protein
MALPALRIRKLTFDLHRFVGLVVGLQLLAWVLGGIVFSWLDLSDVHGDRERRKLEFPPLASSDSLAAPGVALGRVEAEGETATTVTLRSHPLGPVYEVATRSGRPYLVDAVGGRMLTPLSEAGARAIATGAYGGKGSLASFETLEEGPLELMEGHPEFAHELPVYRATFDDGKGTRFYVSRRTGRLLAVRNDRWRVFDFFWMLHVMDYRGRENFNNPLIRAVAPLALLLPVSGLVLWGFRGAARLSARAPRRRRSSPPRL